MKKMRIPLLIAFGIAVIGIIFGSFFDLQLSQAIADRHSVAGLTISALGPTVGFLAICFIAGGFIANALRKDFPTWAKVLFWIGAVGSFGVSVYFAGKEYFGVNGFDGVAPKFLGYLIVLLPMCGVTFLGYWMLRNDKNPNTWVLLLVAAAVMAALYLGPITILKGILHRPRFRAINDYGIAFHNWWEPCRNYKDLMATFNLDSEEFKSYPSGHTATTAFTLIGTSLLPIAYPKLRKIQMPLFVCSFLFCVLVGFGRIMAAAHFLSDVSTGLAFGALFAFIANEVVAKVKFFHKGEEEAPAVKE